MEEQVTTQVDDISEVGPELDEESLRLASGGARPNLSSTAGGIDDESKDDE